MPKTTNDLLCDPVGTTSSQAAINEEEWRNPANWHGVIFPSYSSKLDTRPFVPGRMFRPKATDDLRWAGVLASQVVNRGHPRGRIWSMLGWVSVIGVVVIWVVMGIVSGSR